MNGILNDRKTAWIITSVLIVLAFFGGGAKSLNGLKSAASEIFYNGTDGDGLGIQRELNYRIEYSYNLITVANRYIPDDAAVKQTEAARDALIKSDGVKEKSESNLGLTEAVTALYERLGREKLSEQDARYRENIYTDIKARNNIISNDGYNREAREFNKKLGVFPSSLIKALNLASELPLF